MRAALRACLLAVVLAAAARVMAEPLREWLLWGPYAGMAGLEVLSPGLESRVRPATGDRLPAPGVGDTTEGTWRRYVSPTDRVDLDLPDTFATRPAIMDWSRGCAYAHVYLRAPETQPARLTLRANWRVRAWLNGQRVTAPDVSLRRGWNRLLVKVYYPATWVQAPRGWWFECGLSRPDGAAVPDLTFSLDDPDRDPLEYEPGGKGVAGQTLVTLRAGELWAPVFERGTSVRLELSVACTAAEAPPITRSLQYEVLDFDGTPVGTGEQSVTYAGQTPASVPLDLGKLPVGHYRIIGDLRSEAGVTMYLPPLSFAVLPGPVDRTQDDAPRKLAGCDYWFLNSGEYEGRLWWLHEVGLTMNVGTTATWWAAGDLRKGELSVDYADYIDDGLRCAQDLGIELVGHLEGGWPVAALQPQPRDHWRQEGLSDDYLVVWPWYPLPPFGSPDYETMVRRYVHQTVGRYRDRIHVWKSYNEIDIAGHMPPEQYARIARILWEEVKRTDPDATMTGASLVYLGSDWCRKLFRQTDFAAYHDVYDIHVHPMNPPHIGGDLGNGPSEGLRGLGARLAEGAPDKPVWYGETSPPSAHLEGGRVDQAAAVVKEAAFAIANPRIRKLAWLVPYCAGVSELAVSSPEHYPHPGAIAMNLCNRLLDGRAVLSPLNLGDGIDQLRVTAPGGGETLVLWSDTPRAVALPCTGPSVHVVDVVGREREAPVSDGSVGMELTTTPLFVTSKGPFG